MVVSPRSLPDQAFEIVRERILSAQLPPLQPIRQDALAAELGISKIPLREALTRLEQQGLLRSAPNRGFFVPALDAQEAEEIFELRLQLEPAAAARACALANPTQRAAVLAAHDALARTSDGAQAQVVGAHRQFHLSLIACDSHRITMRLIERLHALADRYVWIHLQPQGRGRRARLEHRALLEAWLAGDAGAVHAKLAKHLSTTLEDLRSQLRKS